MCDLGLIDNTVSERKFIQYGIAESTNDPRMFAHIAYMLQQSVERTLKIYLEFVGVTIPKTHDITTLVSISKDNGSKAIITDWLKANAAMLTLWESKGRYEASLFTTLNELRTSVSEVFRFLDINGFTTKRFEEIDDTVLFVLTSKCKYDVDECSDPVLNVLYNVYIRESDNQKPDTPKTLDKYFESKGIINTLDKQEEIRRLRQLYQTSDMKVIINNVYTDLI